MAHKYHKDESTRVKDNWPMSNILNHLPFESFVENFVILHQNHTHIMNIEKLMILSRLRFNETEKEEIRKDLEKMIHFVNKIGEVDTSGQDDNSIVDYEVSQMRTDEAKPERSGEKRLAVTPFFQDGYFIVPKVIKQ